MIKYFYFSGKTGNYCGPFEITAGTGFIFMNQEDQA